MKSEHGEERIFYWPRDYSIAWIIVGAVIGVLLWIATIYAYPHLVELWRKVTSFFWF
jgi:hypothetical protein